VSQFVETNADVSVSSSAYTTISGMVLSLDGAAGTNYAFKYFFTYRSGSTSPGIKVALIGTAKDQNYAATVLIPGGPPGTAHHYGGVLNNLSTTVVTSVVATSTVGINQDVLAVIEGTFQVSTSGTLNIVVGMTVATTGASNLTIRSGSCGILWRLN
jgi:hypothetical protein